MNEELRCAARYHSMWMAENEYGHYSPGGALGDNHQERAYNAGFEGSYVAENIAAGYLPSARAAVDAWLSSDGHCANIMNGMYTHTGVGEWIDGNYYWTQKFGYLATQEPL